MSTCLATPPPPPQHTHTNSPTCSQISPSPTHKHTNNLKATCSMAVHALQLFFVHAIYTQSHIGTVLIPCSILSITCLASTPPPPTHTHTHTLTLLHAHKFPPPQHTNTQIRLPVVWPCAHCSCFTYMQYAQSHVTFPTVGTVLIPCSILSPPRLSYTLDNSIVCVILV